MGVERRQALKAQILEGLRARPMTAYKMNMHLGGGFPSSFIRGLLFELMKSGEVSRDDREKPNGSGALSPLYSVVAEVLSDGQ